MISGLETLGVQFPKTAIVTFDDRATIATVSRDPERLRTVINGLTTHSTPDCPEGSNAALMTAGRLLGQRRAGDPRDRRRQPPDRPVARGRRGDVPRQGRAAVRRAVRDVHAAAGDLGRAVRAAAAAPAFGGVVGARREPGRGQAAPTLSASRTRCARSARRACSAAACSRSSRRSRPAAPDATRATPTRSPTSRSPRSPRRWRRSTRRPCRGAAALDVELTGSNTGFRPGSAVSVAGTGVSVDSVDVLGADASRRAADGGAGCRDRVPRRHRHHAARRRHDRDGARDRRRPGARGAGLSDRAVGLPSTVAAGETRDVTISGGLTHFAGGSVASFGAGVTVNR